MTLYDPPSALEFPIAGSVAAGAPVSAHTLRQLAAYASQSARRRRLVALWSGDMQPAARIVLPAQHGYALPCGPIPVRYEAGRQMIKVVLEVTADAGAWCEIRVHSGSRGVTGKSGMGNYRINGLGSSADTTTHIYFVPVSSAGEDTIHITWRFRGHLGRPSARSTGAQGWGTPIFGSAGGNWFAPRVAISADGLVATDMQLERFDDYRYDPGVQGMVGTARGGWYVGQHDKEHVLVLWSTTDKSEEAIMCDFTAGPPQFDTRVRVAGGAYPGDGTWTRYHLHSYLPPHRTYFYDLVQAPRAIISYVACFEEDIA